MEKTGVYVWICDVCAAVTVDMNTTQNYSNDGMSLCDIDRFNLSVSNQHEVAVKCFS